MTDPVDPPAAGDSSAPDEPSPLGRELPAGVTALRRALRRAVWVAAAITAASTAVLALAAGLLIGWSGVWGALLGAGLAFTFLATTAITLALTAGRDVLVSGAALMGSWLAKVIVALVVLGSLRDATFFDRRVMLLGVVIGLVVTLWSEHRHVTRAQIPYVEAR